jgi:regulator of cell morphogenesis and NO signaling
MTITPETLVADIVAARPSATKVFQRYKIDFCCEGRHPLGSACRSAGADVGQVLAALEAAPRLGTATRQDWKHASLASLTRHISATYHAPLLDGLPRLSEALARIEREHAARWPELIPPLGRLVRGLAQEISFHTNEEEDRLFPAIVAIESHEAVELHGRTLDRFLERLEDEHFLTGRMLQRLQALTGGFEPPVGACPTLVALYRELSDLAAMVRLHVHLENHVLFPRASALSRARADAAESEAG